MALNPTLGHGKSNLEFRQGDGSALDEVPEDTWEVICANIHKNVLTADMNRYARTLSQGGSLLLSGFFEGDVRDLQEVVERHGLRVLAVDHREGWACMHRVGRLETIWRRPDWCRASATRSTARTMKSTSDRLGKAKTN